MDPTNRDEKGICSLTTPPVVRGEYTCDITVWISEVFS